ncbi:Transcription initiation factor TFIID subunit 4B [Gracilariopsis chorda]|uniref:Transcription initiation factor TFIID subunit 4B n=1 Tax=Gracilariopsis chorda TaxID=448386 RepID=A0A2V3IYU4_9FLOR|nr:Transcription initiation factor TFIID subunit 4B [Gracilariopsis chorda]|eukprot:PXF46857.1 Transcription initiation factor TFIID subunit 4B [Gracilariopsis chorda]
MDKSKNLTELLAAIGNGSTAPKNAAPRGTSSSAPASNQPSAFPQRPAISIPTIPQPISRPTSTNVGAAPTAPTAAAPPTVDGHYKELVTLLQRQPATAVNPQLQQAANPNTRRVATGNPMPLVPPGSQIPTQSLDPKAVAALRRRQQIQAAQVKQRREAYANINRSTQPVPPSFPRSTSQGIPAGIQSVVGTRSVPGNGRIEHTQEGMRNSSNLVAPQRPASASQSGQSHASSSRSITQEQVIVGHFCRHAIKTVTKLMEGRPFAVQIEARLREHIKVVWSQWVRGLISRPQLLQSVATFVKQSNPAAKDVDVIRDFKAWYEHEYEMQRQRTLDQRRQGHQEDQNQVPSQEAPTQTVPRVASHAVHGISQAVRPNVAPQHMVSARSQMKAEQAVIGVPRPSGKTIGTKPVAIRGVAVNRVPPQAPGVGRGPGKSIANKSIGGSGLQGAVNVANSVSSHAMVQKTTPTGQSANKQTVASAMPVSRTESSPKGPQRVIPQAGKSIGGKSLLPNKNTAQSKPKPPRRPAQKTTPKGPVKTPPKGAGKGKSPAAYPFHGGMPSSSNLQVGYHAHAQSHLPGKRVLDNASSSSPPNALKRAKPAPKPSKAPLGKKKPAAAVGNPGPGKGARPPVPKLDPKNRAGKRPAAPGAGLVHSGGASTAPGVQVLDGAGQKKVRRHEDLKEINLVDNVVDIEDEEVKLKVDASGKPQTVEDVVQYSSDMILAGPRLRKKMGTIAKRTDMTEGFTKEAMEVMSLAVRERLASILESLKPIATSRLDSAKEQWGTVATGMNIREKLERMRQDEERALQVAAEMRVKRRKEQKEAEAKKAAGEAAKSDKNSKDSSAAAEADRKEKLALEKKKKESSSQRDAMSGLIREFDRRRRRAAKPLAPLKPLSKPGGLPPIPKRPNSESFGRPGLKPLGSLDNLKAAGPLFKLGRSNSAVPRGLGKAPVQTNVKLRVTLRDCLFLFESDRNTRKSTLIYKWYARLQCGM